MTHDIHDDRTETYLDAIEDDIGLLDRQSTEAGPANVLMDKEGIEHEQVASYDLGGRFGQGDVRVYRYQSPNDRRTLYVATWGLRVAIDAVLFPILTFDHKPSREDIRTSETLRTARWDLGRKIDQTYQCWECGQDTHWLDADPQGEPNDLQSRLDRAERRYCGC
jgi:hypothetical protein